MRESIHLSSNSAGLPVWAMTIAVAVYGSPRSEAACEQPTAKLKIRTARNATKDFKIRLLWHIDLSERGTNALPAMVRCSVD